TGKVELVGGRGGCVVHAVGAREAAVQPVEAPVLNEDHDQVVDPVERAGGAGRRGRGGEGERRGQQERRSRQQERGFAHRRLSRAGLTAAVRERTLWPMARTGG